MTAVAPLEPSVVAVVVDKAAPVAADRAETSDTAVDRAEPAVNTSAVAAPEAVILVSFGRGLACPIPLEQPV